MRKILTVSIAVLISAFCMQPVYAQNAKQDLSNTLKRKMTEATQKKASQKGTCAYCGKEITHQGQHCSANNYTGLCSEKKEETKPVQQTADVEKVCPKCGHKYTIDELYHGVEHHCDADKDQQKATHPVCAYCGEEITEECQHCTAKGCIGLCSETKEVSAQPTKQTEKAPQKGTCAYCGKEITHQGQHCSAKNYTGLCSEKKEETKPVQQTADVEKVCPKCGHKYTIDELYHGVEHICPTK